MTQLSDKIEELLQAVYYVGLYTGKGEQGWKYLREATRRQAEVKAEMQALLREVP